MILFHLLNKLSSLLFTEGNIWMKKGENVLLDVTVGLHDGAEFFYLPTWKIIKHHRQG